MKRDLIKFEKFSDLYPNTPLKHPLTEIVLKNIREGPVLDVGCGNGNLLSSLKERGFDCEGIDPSDIAVKKAKARGIKAKASTIEDFNPSRKFKTILLMDVLPYLNDVEIDFKRISGWLDDDGRILVNLCNRHALRKVLKIGYRDEENFPNYYPTYFEFKRLVEKNGLKIVKSYGGGKFKYFPIFSIAIFYILEKSKVRR